MVKFNAERTYGVEVEFIAPRDFSRADALVAINADLLLYGLEEYCHRPSTADRSGFQIKGDGSVHATTSRDRNLGYGGHEMVSPILKGFSGFEAMSIALNVINRMGAKVNITTGLHVHHGIGDFNGKQASNIIQTYRNNEQVIDQLVAPSRRANVATYCRSTRPLTINGFNHIKNNYANNGKDATVANTLLAFDINTRYYKVNLFAYRAHGTVEFRQHQGTTDITKIQPWIVFTQAIVETAKTRTVSAKADRAVRAVKPWVAEWRALMREMNMLKSKDRDETTDKACKALKARAGIGTARPALRG